MKRPTPWGPILSMGAALLYGVSPVDLIPDIIPILGLVDDAVIIPIVILWSLFTLAHRLKGQGVQEQPRVKPSAAYIDVPSQPVIPREYDSARTR